MTLCLAIARDDEVGVEYKAGVIRHNPLSPTR
jgi:hypothetical protein